MFSKQYINTNICLPEYLLTGFFFSLSSFLLVAELEKTQKRAYATPRQQPSYEQDEHLRTKLNHYSLA